MQISPLRDRKEDIEDLANYFIQIYQGSGEKFTLSSDALHKLQNYDWPGNIRELENVIQRALCFTSAGVLQPEDLHIDAMRATAATGISQSDSKSEPSQATPDNKSAYENFRQQQLAQERDFLIKAIRECNGSVREAAQKLGLFRTALYNRLSHLGVDIKEIR